jgi:hypothetical protein
MDQRVLTVGSLAAIVGAPLLGSSVTLASNSLVRLLLLLFVLYSIKVSDLTGLLSVLAVVSIISERNHSKLTQIPMRMGIPMKRDSLFENIAGHAVPTAHGMDITSDTTYTDSNPRLSPVPTGARSAQFYMDKKLAV